MARFMLHLKNEKYRPPDSRKLIQRARDLCSNMDASVRVARVASKFVEFDIEVEKEDLDLLIEKLNSIGDLASVRNIVEEKIEKETGIKDGIFYLDLNQRINL